MTTLFIALQTSSPLDFLNGMWPLFLIVVVIYFFMIRPQAKKQKAQQNFMDELKSGDQVVTGTGMYGQITKVEDHTIMLKVDSKTQIKMSKSAISQELTEAAYSNKSDDKK